MKYGEGVVKEVRSIVLNRADLLQIPDRLVGEVVAPLLIDLPGIILPSQFQFAIE
jgi:hypothetical protein